MADDRDENFLLLEMELITAQLSAIAVSLQGIDSTLRTMADRMLRLGK
tara:strand:- start:88 stop:231 length:144 start_codon:yes stop_codon:yes gene_type:complete